MSGKRGGTGTGTGTVELFFSRVQVMFLYIAQYNNDDGKWRLAMWPVNYENHPH